MFEITVFVEPYKKYNKSFVGDPSVLDVVEYIKSLYLTNPKLIRFEIKSSFTEEKEDFFKKELQKYIDNM